MERNSLLKQFSTQAKIDPNLLTREMLANEAVGQFASADLYFDFGAEFDCVFLNRRSTLASLHVTVRV